MKTIIAIALIALALTACARRDYAQQDHLACESLGVYWGEPEYAKCRIAIYQSREHRQAQRSANATAIYGAILSNQRRQTQCSTIGSQTTCW